MKKRITLLTAIPSILILAGALFKLQHYPYGDLLFWTGIFTNLIGSAIAITLLTKRVKELETQIQNNQK
ncbi:hypothetical protein [Maribellus sp. YY47]|uniref:hypothetical protein n=1 Tax=Maribellus sp. YY47 TaxID=2929486 RepID=UPI002000C18E|nr:hypothetical protein [Maribellus sp. YY47]MCK3683434.1 hypothetical protein [Maribellus sp. YY47]